MTRTVRRWPELVLLVGVALVALATFGGCGASDPVAILPAMPPFSGFCDGDGPAVIVGDGITVGEADGSTDDVCAGTIARRTFRFALCLCEGYSTSTPLYTDSFAASSGPYTPASAGAGGSVGMNGDLKTNADLDVHGSLWAGELGGQIGATVTIAGDLVHGGGISGAGAVSVGHDATIQGPVSLGGALTVIGKLIVPAIAQVSANPVSAGSIVEATVPVPDPCSCASEDLVDVARFVNLHVSDNDNASIGLVPGTLAGFTASRTLDLPCGRYYLDGIDGALGAALTLNVRGRVVLFVGGDLNLRGPLEVTLDPDAELDLFVGGILQSSSTIDFGDPTRPSKARLYVGGSGMINLSGISVFAGNLYAPQAALALSAQAELYGSLFLRQLTQAAPIQIHYDTDVLSADQGCPLSTNACTTCLDCPAQACNGGSCGACASSDDCCAPLVCESGACVPQH